MDRIELQRIRDWANQKIATGAEPPWSWYQFMKLRETLDAILDGMDCVTPHTASAPQSESHLENGPRLAVSNDQPTGVQVRLPI